MISLGVGTMEIDWERNSYFKDHSALFKPEDVKLIPYYYVGDDDKPLIIEKEGYSKKLKYVKKRLDLLEYTLNEIDVMYDEIKCDALCHELQILLSFDDFANIIKTINVNKINTPKLAVEFEENGYDFGGFVRRCIISEKEIYDKLLEAVGGKKGVILGFRVFFENLYPYIILRLLALC
ncbi:HEPN/Toprim-associated domain-containing protein [Thomasclavelia cocleata]|uniref:HEPN/Toprim-associated domain-containing protein n=1 Tax=Thomasclavelia cocleata TaxID=69824 RepID=UPI0024330EE0|nr:HEPN/Toprim-associated domain-containing protein [Thomasclavelia cocleata]